MGNMIYCDCIEQFAQLCALFQESGLAFTGNGTNLSIEITGF